MQVWSYHLYQTCSIKSIRPSRSPVSFSIIKDPYVLGFSTSTSSSEPVCTNSSWLKQKFILRNKSFMLFQSNEIFWYLYYLSPKMPLRLVPVSKTEKPVLKKEYISSLGFKARKHSFHQWTSSYLSKGEYGFTNKFPSV